MDQHDTTANIEHWRDLVRGNPWPVLVTLLTILWMLLLVQWPESATEEFENALIRQALHLSGGNKNRAATLLGLKRTTFVEMLKRKSLDAGEAPGPVS